MIQFINNHHLPQRLTTILRTFDMKEKRVFPVNMLRNLGIRNIETTHFQVLDMDLWPTTNSFHEMMKLPPSLQKGKVAVIFPIFFFDRKAMLNRCSDLKSCSLL